MIQKGRLRGLNILLAHPAVPSSSLATGAAFFAVLRFGLAGTGVSAATVVAAPSPPTSGATATAGALRTRFFLAGSVASTTGSTGAKAAAICSGVRSGTGGGGGMEIVGSAAVV